MSSDQASANVHYKIGVLTRQLHNSLNELGYADRLRGSAGELPDAQSRLSYIARLTGEAANKVLGQVEVTQSHQDALAERTRSMRAELITPSSKNGNNSASALDLPDPFGPWIPQSEPRGTARFTSWRTLSPLKDLDTAVSVAACSMGTFQTNEGAWRWARKVRVSRSAAKVAPAQKMGRVGSASGGRPPRNARAMGQG